MGANDFQPLMLQYDLTNFRKTINMNLLKHKLQKLIADFHCITLVAN